MIRARKNNNVSQPVNRALDARASSAVSHELQTILKITVSCPVRHTNKFQQQHALRSVTGECFDLRPCAKVEFLGPKQHENQKEDATLRCTRMNEWCRTSSCSLWHQHSVYTRYMGTVETSFICYVPQFCDTEFRNIYFPSWPSWPTSACSLSPLAHHIPAVLVATHHQSQSRSLFFFCSIIISVLTTSSILTRPA